MNKRGREPRPLLDYFPANPAQKLLTRGWKSRESGIISAAAKRNVSTASAGFVLFHVGTRPCELGEGHVNRFLTHLAAKKSVAASERRIVSEAFQNWFHQGQPKQGLGRVMLSGITAGETDTIIETDD